MSRRWAPGITTAQRTAVTLEEREFVFDTDLNRFFVGDGSTVGGLRVALKSELDDEVSAAMTPVVQAATLAEGAARLGSPFWFNISNPLYGASAASSDNYAALNLAIAACNAASGGTIYIPEGDFSVDFADGAGFTSVVAGTRFKGAGRYASTLTINCTTSTYLNAFGNAGDLVFEDLRIVFNLMAGQTAALLVLASNTEFHRCDLVSNAVVVADDDVNDGVWINVPSSGTIDWLVISDCTWSGWHYPLLRANASTAVITNTFITDCQAYDNGLCHLEFNAPNGSWSNIYISNFQMGDQSGVGGGLGFGLAAASCTNMHIRGLGFIGTTDGEAVHIEEAMDGFSLIDFYIEVTSDESGEGDGVVLLNNNVGGVQASPSNFVISNGIIKRTGGAGGRGLWLLDQSSSTPLTNGRVSNVVVSGFSENRRFDTALTSINVEGVTAPFGASGVLYGCTLSNNVTDATNDLDIAAGVCVEQTSRVLIDVSAMTKRLDANWAAGTNQGMRYSGASITDTTYHIYAALSAAGVQDIYADPSSSASTALTHLRAETGGSDYNYVQRIGSIIRASGAIKPFYQDGDEFWWKDGAVIDFNQANVSTGDTNRALTVPTGITPRAIIVVSLVDASPAANRYFAVGATDMTTMIGTDAHILANGGSPSQQMRVPKNVRVNTSAEVKTAVSAADADLTCQIFTHGWVDRRGRD